MQSYLSTMIVIGQKNGFLDRGLILIVVLSAIVPSLQDIGSNTHPDLPICGHVSPFLRRLLFWEGRRGRWAECRQEFARNLRRVGVGLILKLNLEFYIDFEQSYHSNFFF